MSKHSQDMTNRDFKKLVEEIGFSPVPLRFREKIANVALIIEDEPSKEVRKSVGLHSDETLLGLYYGIPHTERGEQYGLPDMPDTITLYRLPILEAAHDDGLSVRRVIEETIWHEVAHHFGLNEQEVEEKERKKSRCQLD